MSRLLASTAALILVASGSVAHATAPLPDQSVAPSGDWRDWGLTPGTWVYRQDARGSIALFGRPGEPADLTLRCDRARAQLYLSRRGEPPPEGTAPLAIRTTSMTRRLSALPTGGDPSYLAVALGVRDPLLDAMGFSRGHFTVEVGDLPVLVVPAWAELLRVVEDCRA